MTLHPLYRLRSDPQLCSLYTSGDSYRIGPIALDPCFTLSKATSKTFALMTELSNSSSEFDTSLQPLDALNMNLSQKSKPRTNQ
jgi:hypothetical protein